MPTPAYDTLIVGQGLAGSALAWHLIAAGERVCVIDDGHRTASSIVAAGLINPLAGMRFNRRPGVRDWLQAAEAWYARLGEQTGRRVLHPLPMLRLFRSAEQQRFYARRADDPDSADLIGPRFGADTCPEAVAADHGGFVQQRTAYVDLPLLLSALGDWLDERQAMRRSLVTAAEIDVGAERVAVGGISARRLVFCDGARLRDNPWFDWLPLLPDRGEILDLQHAHWRPRHIVNGAHWLVPMHDGRLRVGATHDHERLDDGPTAAGRRALLDAYRALRPGDDGAAVVGHTAGLRPGTADREPLIGRHPTQRRLWVFNGFGARGALSIPWYAARLADHLHRGAALPAAADIRRL